MDFNLDNRVKSLFLDRDGVINQKPKDKYIKSWGEFKFAEGSLDAIKILSNFFDYIFVVTNQRGVGKKLMSEKDLQEIHGKMCDEVNAHGGKIHKVYSATDIDYSSLYLKPNLGMAYQAKFDFPEIVFDNSVVIGDSITDMEFGKRLEMKTVGIGFSPQLDVLCDYTFSSLIEVAKNLRDYRKI